MHSAETRYAKFQYTEAEAAQELAISVKQLRGLIQTYILHHGDLKDVDLNPSDLHERKEKACHLAHNLPPIS
jgi:hypothetical protein